MHRRYIGWLHLKKEELTNWRGGINLDGKIRGFRCWKIAPRASVMKKSTLGRIRIPSPWEPRQINLDPWSNSLSVSEILFSGEKHMSQQVAEESLLKYASEAHHFLVWLSGMPRWQKMSKKEDEKDWWKPNAFSYWDNHIIVWPRQLKLSTGFEITDASDKSSCGQKFKWTLAVGNHRWWKINWQRK